jgi:hypothetical protein
MTGTSVNPNSLPAARRLTATRGDRLVCGLSDARRDGTITLIVGVAPQAPKQETKSQPCPDFVYGMAVGQSVTESQVNGQLFAKLPDQPQPDLRPFPPVRTPSHKAFPRPDALHFDGPSMIAPTKRSAWWSRVNAVSAFKWTVPQSHRCETIPAKLTPTPELPVLSEAARQIPSRCSAGFVL